jgi:uncharacterized protein
MIQKLSLVLEPEIAFEATELEKYVLQNLNLNNSKSEIFIKPLKRSIDARSRNIKVNVELEVFVDERPASSENLQKNYPNVSNSKQAVIVGAGPAGMFAALRLIELGIKPIVLERGKDVRARRRDLAAINKDHIVNPESNYCFGEGGAGTY